MIENYNHLVISKFKKFCFLQETIDLHGVVSETQFNLSFEINEHQNFLPESYMLTCNGQSG